MPDIALSKRLEMEMRGTRNFMVGDRGQARAFELLVLQLLRLPFFWKRRGCQGLSRTAHRRISCTAFFPFCFHFYN